MQIRKRAGLIGAGIFGLPWAALSVFAFIADLPNIHGAKWSDAMAQYAGAAVLGIIGFGILGIAVIQWTWLAEMDRCRAANPDKQWLWRRDWTEGRADDIGYRKMRLLWFFASLWTVLFTPLLFLVVKDVVANSSYPALFLLIFPAASFGWIFWAIKVTRRWQKFGQTSFAMASVPFSVNESVVGAIEFRKPFQSDAKFHLELTCSQRVKQKNSDGKTRIEDNDIWSDEKDARLDANGRLPVEFELPKNACATDLKTSGREITWQLDVEGRVKGCVFKASFDVLVFNV